MISKNKRRSTLLIGILLLILLLFGSGASAAAGGNSGIVSSVIKAPVTSDGNVAGARTDLVINLDVDMNPAVDGRSLLAGRTIKITLPDDFIQADPPLPFQTAIAECVPSVKPPVCNTGVLLQGWPQRPIPPTFYTISLEGTHTVVFTANQDLIPNTGPILAGIKQMHLLLSGYFNPKPGMYDIAVEAETGPGGAVEYGVGRVHILPNPAPSVNVTSVFNPPPPFPNSIYQTTTVGTPTLLSFDLLMWDKNGDPLVGAVLEEKNPGHSLLRLDGKATVGHVRIDTPPGASGYGVTATGPSSFLPSAPVFGNPAGLMSFFFEAEQSGDYVITYSLNGGNEVKMFVTVTDPT
jgi:hypothetical protein